MSDNLCPPPPTRMTIDELGGSLSVKKNNPNMAYSAFSTATPHEHALSTNQLTNGESQHPRQLYASPLQKYKLSLNLFGKEETMAFKQTTYVVPKLEDDSAATLTQKQNNKGLLNTENAKLTTRHGKDSNTGQKYIPWKSATKVQTAEIVRTLFGGQKIDYNLEYRKKRFFENFSNKF